MAETPQYLMLVRHRDLRGRSRQPWNHEAMQVGVVLVVPLLGLAGVFGREPVVSAASSPDATLKVTAADALRGGLLGQAKFEVTARSNLKHATLVLDRGWWDGLQLNTIAPGPLGETERAGRLALDFGHVPAGSKLLVRIQFQVNPTLVGSRPQGVEVDDGRRPIVRVNRTLTVFPQGRWTSSGAQPSSSS